MALHLAVSISRTVDCCRSSPNSWVFRSSCSKNPRASFWCFHSLWISICVAVVSLISNWIQSSTYFASSGTIFSIGFTNVSCKNFTSAHNYFVIARQNSIALRLGIPYEASFFARKIEFSWSWGCIHGETEQTKDLEMDLEVADDWLLPSPQLERRLPIAGRQTFVSQVIGRVDGLCPKAPWESILQQQTSGGLE